MVSTLVIGWWAGCRPVLPPTMEVVHFDDAPLSPLLEVRQALPVRVTVEMTDGSETIRLTSPTASLVHHIPLLGLKPGRQWEVEVCSAVSDQCVGQSVQMPELPDDFPEIDVLAHAHPTEGYLLLPITLAAPGQPGWLAALDTHDLEVAWLLRAEPLFRDVTLTPDGRLIGLRNFTPSQLDLHGQPVRQWDLGIAHHELFVDADGTLWTLVERLRDVPAYPSSYEAPTVLDQATTLLASDVVHFDADGHVLSEWTLADRLADTRIGFGSLSWKPNGPSGPGFDWGHANAVLPRPDGSVIVSVRNQGVAALDAEGELMWILSDPAGWPQQLQPFLLQPHGEVAWPYHQHAPALDAEGRLVLFDNQAVGHTPYTDPPDEPLASRVVAYEIDEGQRRVRQAWSFEPPGPRLTAPTRGDADPLDSGRVLAHFGAIHKEGGVPNVELGWAGSSVRILEFDPWSGEVALDVRLSTPVHRDDDGVTSYRSQHVAQLYPHDTDVRRTLP
ncbi:MAG: aryl-sulfate sulfotransferase [Myxococcales bacterium]|nr:aryl-sulfate sulfotransferase [Myxococcales bacterium]